MGVFPWFGEVYFYGTVKDMFYTKFEGFPPSFLPVIERTGVVLLFLYAPVICFLTNFIFFVYFIETPTLSLSSVTVSSASFILLKSFPLAFIFEIFSFSILSSFWSIFSSIVLLFFF